MKFIRSLLICLCLCELALAQSNTDITLVVKDQQTGFAIPGASVTVTSPNGTTTNLTVPKNGKVTFPATDGKYSFRINAGNYKPIETFFSSGDEPALEAQINLDPVTPVQLPIKNTAPDAINITGYVSDADDNTALAGVQVQVGGATATTNDKGFFTLASKAPLRDLSKQSPDKITIRSGKSGYVNNNVQSYAIAGDYTLKIKLTSANSPRLKNARISEETETPTHGLFDRTDADQQARFAETPATNNNARVTAAVPGTIRVGTGCSCHSCPTVVVMSLEAYVESGLDEEWISSWRAASLQAGAVAYRSYGAFHVLNPRTANFDISSTTCAQVWASDVVASTRDAARATAGQILIRNGGIFRAEYSAETNGHPNCGNGFSGDRTNWPCIPDGVCSGATNAGHSRGMCQWGSQRWSATQNAGWILDHYYTPAGVSVQQPGINLPYGVYRAINPFSGKYLDASGCTGANGSITNIYSWTGADCQRWLFEPLGDGYYKISCRLGGRVIDNDRCLADNANKIQLWDWLNNDCQRWLLRDLGNGEVAIVNKFTGKVLDVAGAGTANGTQVFQYAFSGGIAQRWRLEEVSSNYIADGLYRIKLERTGRVLAPANGVDVRGSIMTQSDWLDSNYQKWQVTATPDGWYKVTSAKGSALDVDICNTLDGGKVMLWDWLNNNCQRWGFSTVPGGKWAIVSRNSKKVLDAAGDANGGTVYQWTWLNNANQIWLVEPTTFTTTGLKAPLTTFTLSPNPVGAGRQVQVNYTSTVAQAGTIIIADVFGKPVQQRAVSVQKGANRFTFTTNQLRPGIYHAYMQLQNNRRSAVQKVIVK